ncbi:hypothetical protein CDAR_424041 [Caerostris darwini]|uniref:Uncharacterized protein n=1 Tax=Caerostris darwini TaxID=1538125 RepID=A0AAV4T5G2_9ARAC|nr:hypothetical protein CDAR_424041 [Caerostris darwini]
MVSFQSVFKGSSTSDNRISLLTPLDPPLVEQLNSEAEGELIGSRNNCPPRFRLHSHGSLITSRGPTSYNRISLLTPLDPPLVEQLNSEAESELIGSRNNCPLRFRLHPHGSLITSRKC